LFGDGSPLELSTHDKYLTNVMYRYMYIADHRLADIVLYNYN